MSGGRGISQVDRAGWQRRAAAELARILDAHPQLPAITWTVGPAGCVLAGRVNGLAPARWVRAVFAAWQAALALEDGRERPCGDGTLLLRAAARRAGVDVWITATVFVGDDDTPVTA